MRKLVIAVIMGVIAAMSVAACGGHSAKGQVQVPTSAANTKVVNQVNVLITSCVEKVSTFKLLTKSGRKKVVTCLESQVPPAKRAQLEKCLMDTALADKVWSRAGRIKFETVDAANCISATKVK